MTPKKKGTLQIRRASDCKVSAGIIDENGQIEEQIEFGEFTPEQYELIIEIIKQETSGVEI